VVQYENNLIDIYSFYSVGIKDRKETFENKKCRNYCVCQGVPAWPGQGRLYNISNFGDTSACYSDVEPGDERLFFLTLFSGRLSAKYDDLFGAVADRTADNEDEILQALGQSTSSCLADILQTLCLMWIC